MLETLGYQHIIAYPTHGAFGSQNDHVLVKPNTSKYKSILAIYADDMSKHAQFTSQWRRKHLATSATA